MGFVLHGVCSPSVLKVKFRAAAAICRTDAVTPNEVVTDANAQALSRCVVHLPLLAT